jgi:phosphatidylglycerophosphatase A
MTDQLDAASNSPSSQRPSGNFFAVCLGTGLGVGFIPFAPGTWGSLWGPLLIWSSLKTSWSKPALISFGVVFVALGVPICTRAARAIGKKDPGSVVYDEIAAFWLVYLPQVLGWRDFTWVSAVLGFLLFRLFDITKPWPVRRLEKLPDGLGIMADDLAAGVYAGGLLAIVETVIARQ